MSIAREPAGLATAETPAEPAPKRRRNGICATSTRRPRRRRSRPTWRARCATPRRSRRRPRAGSPISTATALGAVIERYERIEEQLGRLMSYAAAAARRQGRRPADRPLLPDDPRAGHQGRHQAPVPDPGAEQDRGCRRSPRSSSSRRCWPATGRGCATCAPSGRISSTTRSSGCCTRSRSPAAAPGSGCSTRPWRACGFPSTARSSPAARSSTCSRTATAPSGKRRRPRSPRCSTPNVRLFALITNTLAKDKQIEDDWRHFARPISSRNLANHVEDAGGRRADRRGPRRLSPPVAPLLSAEGALARARSSRALGSQRAAARGQRQEGRLVGRQGHRARRLPRLLAAARRRSSSASSASAGSMPPCGRARMPARSATRPCRACTPTCS